MAEQNHKNGLEFSPLAINWIANNAAGLLGNFDSNPHYMTTPESNRIHPGTVSVPQWMHCQPTSQNYVEFLAERGYPVSTQVPSLGLAYPSQLEEYLEPHNEGYFITTGLESQFGLQKQNCSEECNHTFETYSESGTLPSEYPSEARKKRSREKAYAADRLRRLRISHGLDALKEFVPHTKGAGKSALLDDVIGHIKYLQYKVKDLGRSRLGGESTSNSVIFLEGHGHYFVKEQMLNGPLEELIGKLIDVYPSAATEMLQSRGLIVMPVTFIEGLLESMEMLDMQDKGASFNLQVMG